MHRIEAYITLGLIFIAIISIIYLPVLLIIKKKGITVTRQIGYIGIICSVFLIIFATILFVPINLHPDKYILNINPLDWLQKKDNINQFIVEKIPNVLLFIPLGFFIPVVFKSKRKFFNTALVVFVMTFSVEFIQYFIGRSADIVDILTNLLGGIIGYVIYFVLNKIMNHKKCWKKLINEK